MTDSGMQDRSLGLLSVVAPMYNEEATLQAFYERVCSALDDLPFELIAVNDGSSDATAGLLGEIADADSRVRVITLSRNFGHQAALTAGLDHARGDAVTMLDADLQDPPEVIPQLLHHWQKGSDVVYAVRIQRPGEPWFRARATKWFYKLFGRISEVEYLSDAGDFRLLDRRALDALSGMRERNRFLRGMSVWLGFTQTAVPYDRDIRYAGETKYPLTKLIGLAIDGLSSFSRAPLRIAAVIGFVVSALAFIGIPTAAVLRLAGLYKVQGIASLTLLILALGGIQLVTLGIIGEYLGRIYDEVKRRPLYIVRDRVNFSEPDGPPVVPPEHAEGGQAMVRRPAG
jgi:glycosyltransferase involved in cell wall biosynthesis